MFEQAFKNIDDVLWKEAGCTTKLDYTEQTSWLLFLKYLDGLEQDKAMEAQLDGKKYSFILDPPYRWESWAAPKGRDGTLDHNAALTGDDLRDVPNGKALAKCFLVEEANTYTLNQRICLIRSTKFHTKFLFFQLNRNRHFLGFDNGENQTNLRLNQVLSCPLFMPPFAEQKTIAENLEALLEKTQRLARLYERKLAALEALKKSLLHHAFSGEL